VSIVLNSLPKSWKFVYLTYQDTQMTTAGLLSSYFQSAPCNKGEDLYIFG